MWKTALLARVLTTLSDLRLIRLEVSAYFPVLRAFMQRATRVFADRATLAVWNVSGLNRTSALSAATEESTLKDSVLTQLKTR